MTDDLIGQAWEALTGGDSVAPVGVGVTVSSGHLSSAFRAEDTAVACVAVALRAAAALRGVETVTVDRSHVCAAVRSERYFLRDGKPAGASFAPLSRFWRTSAGWVRTHANYPWHRAALVRAVGTDDDVEALTEALAAMRATEIEERVFAAGGVAAAVRTDAAWAAHPQGRAVIAEPLIAHQRMGTAPPRSPGRLRVLDLTRVIAGPVCTRFLGALGADVLRLDPPRHPDLPAGETADTLLGKRSAALDFGDREQLARFHALADGADIIVSGYRPGSFDRFGLDPDTLAERHPGVVIVAISAWGHTGPWVGRRGFDSVVQAPSGIAVGETPPDTEDAMPGALPCQLLDHGTGYLAAAAALDGVRRQAIEGGSHVRRVSLARTAAWLVATKAGTRSTGTPSTGAGDTDPTPWMVELGDVQAVAPPGALDGRPLTWEARPSAYLSDPPAWGDARPSARGAG